MGAPISKDWWLAAALAGAALPAAVGQTQLLPTPASRQEGQQIGVVTSISQGRVPPSVSRPIYVSGTNGQKLSTGANESLHVLFSDQSAMTLGPNSELTIANYQFDAKKQDGQLAVDLAKGFLRVVGGFLSKKRDTVVITATATIGIRGAVVSIEATSDSTKSTLQFGEQMTVKNNITNSSETVKRPGYTINSNRQGNGLPTRLAPSAPIILPKSPIFIGVLDDPDRIKSPPGDMPNTFSANSGSNTQPPSLATTLGTAQPPYQS